MGLGKHPTIASEGLATFKSRPVRWRLRSAVCRTDESSKQAFRAAILQSDRSLM
jgi:hypothetical protein